MAGESPGTSMVPLSLPVLPARPLGITVARRTAAATSLTDEKYTGATGIDQASEQLAQGRRELPDDREAWTAVERVTEVRTLVSGSANLLSQVHLFPGIEVWENGKLVQKPLRDEDGKALEGFTEQFVADCEDSLARFSSLDGRQSSIIRGLAENFQVTGRARLVGFVIDARTGKAVENDADGENYLEKWLVVSPGAVYRDTGTASTTGAPKPWRLHLTRFQAITLPRAVVKEFLWPSSRYPDEGSSWVRATLDVLRDMRAFHMANRAAARSGIPADLFLIPAEASPNALPAWAGGGAQPGSQGWGPGADGEVKEGEEPEDEWAVKVEKMVGEFILGVLADADAGNSAVPGVMSIESRFIEFFKRISFSRPIDRGIAELARDARTRLASAADAPPEMLLGLGKTNRWNGIQIADDEYRRYFAPKMNAIADGMTEVCFWPEMKARGYETRLVRQVRVLADPHAVIAQPDYTKIAPLALQGMAIGPKGFRMLMHIPEGCAPTDAELELMKSMKAGKGAAGPGQGDTGAPGPTNVDEQQALAEGDIGGGISTPNVTLALEADPMATLGRDLVPVELRTRARLEEACEAALDVLLDRAGAKLRNWARSDAALRELADQPVARPGAVAHLLGPEHCLRLANAHLDANDDRTRREQLFAAALVALLASWRRIALDAFAAATTTVGGRATGTVPPEEIDAAITRSEDVLRDSMMMVADGLVFGTPTAPTVGEVTSLRVPTTVIRRAMATAGGNLGVGPGLEALVDAALGLVFGPLLARILPAQQSLEWIYGDEPRQRPFEPHMALDGQVYASAQDERLRGSVFAGSPYWFPGDHRGCECVWVPTYRGS